MSLGQIITAKRLWLALALLVVALGSFGCASTGDEPENASSKPWNSPEGWQNGILPQNMGSH